MSEATRYWICESCWNAWDELPGKHWADDEGQDTNCNGPYIEAVPKTELDEARAALRELLVVAESREAFMAQVAQHTGTADTEEVRAGNEAARRVIERARALSQPSEGE